MAITVLDVVDFLLVGVILKGIIAHWISDAIVWVFKKVTVRTRSEIDLWNKYWQQGHTPKSKR